MQETAIKTVDTSTVVLPSQLGEYADPERRIYRYRYLVYTHRHQPGQIVVEGRHTEVIVYAKSAIEAQDIGRQHFLSQDVKVLPAGHIEVDEQGRQRQIDIPELTAKLHVEQGVASCDCCKAGIPSRVEEGIMSNAAVRHLVGLAGLVGALNVEPGLETTTINDSLRRMRDNAITDLHNAEVEVTRLQAMLRRPSLIVPLTPSPATSRIHAKRGKVLRQLNLAEHNLMQKREWLRTIEERINAEATNGSGG